MREALSFVFVLYFTWGIVLNGGTLQWAARICPDKSEAKVIGVLCAACMMKITPKSRLTEINSKIWEFNYTAVIFYFMHNDWYHWISADRIIIANLLFMKLSLQWSLQSIRCTPINFEMVAIKAGVVLAWNAGKIPNWALMNGSVNFYWTWVSKINWLK